MKKSLLILFAGILFYNNLLAATITSTATGNWSVGTTWVGGIPPVNGDNVIIATGHTVTVDVTRAVNWMEVQGSVIINVGITLTISGCDNGSVSYGQQFTIDGATPGALTNYGTFVFDQGACGGSPLYENQGGSTFTNEGTFTMNNGGSHNESGTFVNGTVANPGTINITSTTGATIYTNNTSIDNTDGTININSGSQFINAVGFAADGTINVNAGATFQHAVAGASTIPACAWNTTSTCLITGPTTSVPGGLSQTFGNVTWDCASQGINLNLAGNLTTIAGNLTINNIGSNRTLQLATTTGPTIGITGNLVMAAGGTDALQLCTNGSPTVTVGGNVVISGGRIHLTSGSGNPILNVTGNFTISSTTASAFLMSSSASTGIGTMNLTGNYNYSSATASLIAETNTSTGKGVILFNRAGTQTYSTNAAVTTPFAGTIQVTVDAGSILDMTASGAASLSLVAGSSQTFTVDGSLITGTKTIASNDAGTVFALSAGAKLTTNNVSGVSGTITGAGTRTFAATANYVLGGASTTTGFTGANTTMNNLTLNASATLGETIIVNGTLLNSAGTFAAGTHTITANGTFSNAGTFNGNTSTLKIPSVFTNSGTFNGNDGTVVFNGGAAQTIAGTSAANFGNIILDNASGLSLAQNANLLRTLTLTTGTFAIGAFTFTLISNSSGTGNIGSIPAAGADITGDITIQRYTGTGPSDWRFLCSPVAGRTLGHWNAFMPMSGFTGSDCPPTDCTGGCSTTCNWTSVYTYDETVLGMKENGFVGATNTTNTIDDGKGFWVYVGANPITFAVTGVPYKQDKSALVNYTVSGGPTEDGWNVVSNPYPSAIDWDAAEDATHWTKSNIGATIYIWNSSTGSFASYPFGGPLGTNGGSRYIASQQAYNVQAIGAAPDLTVRELCKANTYTTTFLRTAQSPNTSPIPMAFKDFPVPLSTNNTANILRLTATGGGFPADEILIRFKQGATNNFDNQYDGWKMKGYYYNLSSLMSGTGDYSINSLPDLTSNVSIPIRLTIPVGTGTVVCSLSRDSILMIPKSSCITLEDKATTIMTDLRTNVTYTFVISDTTVAPRFILHITPPVIKNSARVSCSGGSNGKAMAKGLGAGPWDYVWKNSSDVTVQTTLGSSTADTLHNCLAGTYSVIVSGGPCGTVTDTIQVIEPAVLANSFSVLTACFAGSNGSASVTTFGGNLPYSYLWQGGQTTSAAVNLSAGSYTLTVTDSKGCAEIDTATVGQASAVTNTVTPTSVSCYGGNNGLAAIMATGGTPGYSYSWSNGASVSSISNLSAQIYTVTVTDSRGCTSTGSVSIGQPAAALSNTVTGTDPLCFGGSNGSAVASMAGGTAPYSYSWSNGASVSSISNLSAQIYTLTVTDSKGCTSTASVSLGQPAVLSSTVTGTDPSCFGGNNGNAVASMAGGTAPYSYSWSTGASTSAVSSLIFGNYSLTITDAKGCTATGSVLLSQPAAIVAGYTASSYTVDIALGSTVTFTNTSSGAISYQWNFGDGSALDVSVNPAHTYTAIGSYTVVLTALDGSCSNGKSDSIVVINSNPTALPNNNYSSGVSVGYEKGEVYLLFSLPAETQINISVFNVLGEQILHMPNLLVKQDRVRLDFPPTSVGVYIAVSEMSNAVVSKKIFVPFR